MNEYKIKVCGMTDPYNVQRVAALNPDFMGFIFYSRSVRYVGKQPARSLFDEIPKGPEKVAVFVNEYYERIIELTGKYEIDTVQLHGMESPEVCNSLRMMGKKVIKVFPGDQVGNLSLIKDYQDVSDYFLFDTPVKSYGGSGRKFNWELLKNLESSKAFFLSGGIGPEDVESLKNINLGSLFAIDVNSRFEDEPGIKNIEMLEKFIKGIRNE